MTSHNWYYNLVEHVFCVFQLMNDNKSVCVKAGFCSFVIIILLT